MSLLTRRERHGGTGRNDSGVKRPPLIKCNVCDVSTVGGKSYCCTHSGRDAYAVNLRTMLVEGDEELALIKRHRQRKINPRGLVAQALLAYLWDEPLSIKRLMRYQPFLVEQFDVATNRIVNALVAAGFVRTFKMTKDRTRSDGRVERRPRGTWATMVDGTVLAIPSPGRPRPPVPDPRPEPAAWVRPAVVPEVGTCASCGEIKSILSADLCGACYWHTKKKEADMARKKQTWTLLTHKDYLALFDDWRVPDVARKLGVSESAVRQWKRKIRAPGEGYQRTLAGMVTEEPNVVEGQATYDPEPTEQAEARDEGRRELVGESYGTDTTISNVEVSVTQEPGLHVEGDVMAEASAVLGGLAKVAIRGALKELASVLNGGKA